jgi:signal transduction histidine kinase
MDATQTFESDYTPSRVPALDRLFETAKKTTVIQLRWPLVILCSYLLLFSTKDWMAPGQVSVILGFYLLTNITLYFVADEVFARPLFYGAVVVFDTLFMVFVLGFSGRATPDFYLACFLTLVLSCVCDSTRGLLIVTALAPLIYAYVLFNSGTANDPSMYLRLPFPFVIAIFYGYFAQVERLRKQLSEKQEEAERERRLAEEVSRQRDRLRALHKIFDAVNSTLELDRSLNDFLDRALEHVAYKATCVHLTDEDGSLKLACSRHIDWDETVEPTAAQILGDRVVKNQGPVIMHNMAVDPSIVNSEPLSKQGLIAYLGVPLMAHNEILGVLAFFATSEAAMTRENIEFVTTLADQAANAIQKCRLYEKIQHQAAELSKSNKIKDEFLGVVSHELKTPLNVISGYTNMLIEGMMGETMPIQEKALQTILRQSNDLHAMINSLLQVSSIDAEAVQADYIETNFWEFLYELKCCYDYAFSRDVQLTWDFPSELPRLYADRGKLKHILQNLINNAVKFTERGDVRISARYLASKRMMEFKVSDTGIGIPTDALAVIFEKFRQVDSSESRAHGGTGLGLYIVKKFTQLLEGTVHVESKQGAGSTFTVRVPCPRRDPTSAHEQLTFPINTEAPGNDLA